MMGSMASEDCADCTRDWRGMPVCTMNCGPSLSVKYPEPVHTWQDKVPEVHGRSKKEFGEILADYRRGMKMTQEQVARVIGVQHQVMNKWEQGRSYPYGSNLIKLMHLYAIPVSVFIDFERSGERYGETE